MTFSFLYYLINQAALAVFAATGVMAAVNKDWDAFGIAFFCIQGFEKTLSLGVQPSRCHNYGNAVYFSV